MCLRHIRGRSPRDLHVGGLDAALVEEPLTPRAIAEQVITAKGVEWCTVATMLTDANLFFAKNVDDEKDCAIDASETNLRVVFEAHDANGDWFPFCLQWSCSPIASLPRDPSHQSLTS